MQNNIIDLQSTRVARTGCFFNAEHVLLSTTDFEELFNWIRPPFSEWTDANKNWHLSSGLTVDRDSSISSELTYASAVSPLIASWQN